MSKARQGKADFSPHCALKLPFWHACCVALPGALGRGRVRRSAPIRQRITGHCPSLARPMARDSAGQDARSQRQALCSRNGILGDYPVSRLVLDCQPKASSVSGKGASHNYGRHSPRKWALDSDHPITASSESTTTEVCQQARMSAFLKLNSSSGL
ncbi:hypothetical protein N658DRAFT_140811 [Parathielavia hyrcaniae]|uniref:Uncharacterized protein n=1 Tax=Parathielavia hyrcaniae TaxID=113614 RepID=A0AAN6PY95_9PEZI|nr:hypothetical protein N658DRAFT_140811 [Parathielavia hyrcaniae]